jgi:hypothetical protein
MIPYNVNVTPINGTNSIFEKWPELWVGTNLVGNRAIWQLDIFGVEGG